MAARLMAVQGHVQFDEAVIHVVAHAIVDRNDALTMLSADELRSDLARADHVKHPLPSHECYPRDARIIPKSRDVH